MHGILIHENLGGKISIFVHGYFPRMNNFKPRFFMDETICMDKQSKKRIVLHTYPMCDVLSSTAANGVFVYVFESWGVFETQQFLDAPQCHYNVL